MDIRQQLTSKAESSEHELASSLNLCSWKGHIAWRACSGVWKGEDRAVHTAGPMKESMLHGPAAGSFRGPLLPTALCTICDSGQPSLDHRRAEKHAHKVFSVRCPPWLFINCIHTPLQVALATSLDLRCFLLMLPRNDGSIVLELRDIQLQRTWTIEELWARCLTQTGEVSMDGLKQLAGVRSDKETPSVQSLATLAFLYLLMHIYQDKLRCVHKPACLN